MKKNGRIQKGHNKELIGEYVHIHSLYREEENQTI